MKYIKFIPFVLIALIVFACKKSTSNVVTEKPLQSTLSQKLVIDTVSINNNLTFEFGNKIYFSKNGKVTGLGCRMPTKNSFRVSLWDFDTQNLITAVTIAVTDTANFKYVSIPAVDIVASKRYVLSINNTISGVKTPYFIAYKKAFTNIYPFTNGSVTYEDLRNEVSLVSIFPGTVQPLDQILFAGFPDLVFEYTP